MDQICDFSSLVKTNNILPKNNFFSDLCLLMKNPQFSNFYNAHFNDWSDIQSIIVYMKLYSTISHSFRSQYNRDITDEEMTFMLHNIMTNSKSRKFVFDIFNKYKSSFNNSNGFSQQLTTFF